MKDWSPDDLIRRGLIAVFWIKFTGYPHRSGLRSWHLISIMIWLEEYLVYAHSAPGDKIALQQIIDISRRLTGGLDLAVAYDDKTTYPYWWYLRNFPNQRYFGSTPTRDLT